MDTAELQKSMEELDNALSKYLDACQAYDTASREKTACLNSLNQAQRNFDEVLDKVKGQASAKGSDWGSDKFTQIV